jgi:hypothetical protein
MSIRLVAVSALAGLVVLASSGRADAQSMAPLSRAKAAATRAVAATNAHTQAMQNDGATTPTPARGQKTASAPRAANGPSHPASATVPAHAAAGKGKPGSAAAARASEEAGTTSSVAERGEKGEVALVRESFTYEVDGRRDPFMSLMRSGDLRPMISDLKLVTIIYDPTGRSVAILRDVTTKEQYRVRVGQTLGRMRVAQIQPKSVTFTLEELGFSRQEVLALNDITSARSQ